tara:strand:+ start:5495 stop:6049 length:555 start_codon:yes stop_codon:yes gene_type:complete
MIFTVKDGIPSITLEGINIPEFKAIWIDDNDSEGRLAFSYHHFQSHHNPKNTYYNLSPEDKIPTIQKDCIKNKEWDLEKDTLVLDAINKLNVLLPTASSRMLHAAESTAHRLSAYFESVDFTKMKFDREGNEVEYYDPKKVVDTLKNLSGVVKTIQDLKIQVAKEWEGNRGKLKGSQSLSIFDE